MSVCFNVSPALTWRQDTHSESLRCVFSECYWEWIPNMKGERVRAGLKRLSKGMNNGSRSTQATARCQYGEVLFFFFFLLEDDLAFWIPSKASECVLSAELLSQTFQFKTETEDFIPLKWQPNPTDIWTSQLRWSTRFVHHLRFASAPPSVQWCVSLCWWSSHSYRTWVRAQRLHVYPAWVNTRQGYPQESGHSLGQLLSNLMGLVSSSLFVNWAHTLHTHCQHTDPARRSVIR